MPEEDPQEGSSTVSFPNKRFVGSLFWFILVLSLFPSDAVVDIYSVHRRVCFQISVRVFFSFLCQNARMQFASDKVESPNELVSISLDAIHR